MKAPTKRELWKSSDRGFSRQAQGFYHQKTDVFTRIISSKDIQRSPGGKQQVNFLSTAVNGEELVWQVKKKAAGNSVYTRT